eukprot:TRINITY_DN2031_c1_g1_i19.p4 TRINITY_DN2031_c1_g1~~TRINITY_DN2031_c1_g1_i19.p4  ORF type:complete len:204 (+),score=-25.43 TRINITY_DN2031_c1_g1_i19:2007-2618(+)
MFTIEFVTNQQINQILYFSCNTHIFCTQQKITYIYIVASTTKKYVIQIIFHTLVTYSYIHFIYLYIFLYIMWVAFKKCVLYQTSYIYIIRMLLFCLQQLYFILFYLILFITQHALNVALFHSILQQYFTVMFFPQNMWVYQNSNYGGYLPLAYHISVIDSFYIQSLCKGINFLSKFLHNSLVCIQLNDVVFVSSFANFFFIYY